MTATKTNETTLLGSDLVPDFDQFEGLGIASVHAYYMGVIEGCPVSQIDCAGLNFPMINEIFKPDPARPGQRKRHEVVGGMNRAVTEVNIRALREVLPRTVIRFKAAQDEERGTGKNIGSLHTKRKGFLITIPTAAELALKRKNGYSAQPYIRQPGDEPAVRYMYMHPCPDQKKPARGHDFTTIEESGITWPGEIDGLAALLGE